MRILLNTKALLFPKTGIGYYVHNLYRGLLHSKDVLVYPTIDIPSSNILRLISKGAQAFRKVFGEAVLKISIPVGDFLISKREKRNNLPVADIYHETSHDEIPKGTWKTVATVHDLAFVHHPDYLPENVVQKYRSNLEYIVKADRFIVTTEAIKREVMFFLNISEEQIDVIPLAPSGNYYPVNKDTMEGKKYVNRYTQGNYILFVGTIEPRKNIPTILKAFSILKKRDHLTLILAGGKGWLYDDILALPHNLGIQDDVVFTGYVDEKTILYLYNYATAVLYPSFYEGFGLPVIEAMSCGVPVIISDIPPLREVTKGAALVFNPDDHEELAHKIEMILSSESLRSELIQKGLQKANEYSWEKVVTSTIQAYKKALER
jgi:glycosyltransferase involved in cell wall biosynthesis